MMKHQPLLDSATMQAETTHSLHRDFETRSKTDLKKVGTAVYAADPSTEITWLGYAVTTAPCSSGAQGIPSPAWFEAAVNPSWTAVAHNDAFESAIELHILHPRYGFPLIPPNRHRCTQAKSLALGLPAKLGLLADVLEQANRKDSSGERLMHQMSKPRKARKDEDPAGVYWFEDDDRMQRLGAYNVQHVEVEREADNRLSSLPDAEQKVWELSNLINARGFHVDRKFAQAARKIAEAAAPEINAEITSVTDGAVTGIAQIGRLLKWLQEQGCAATKLDRKSIEKYAQR